MYECVAKMPVNEARASGFLRVYGKFVVIIRENTMVSKSMYECVAKMPVTEARASGFLRVYGKFVIIGEDTMVSKSMYECVAKMPVNEARASGFLRVYGKFVHHALRCPCCNLQSRVRTVIVVTSNK